MNGTSHRERKAPDSCPRCALERKVYIEHYLKFWGSKTNTSGAGRAWAWHTSPKARPSDCDGVKNWLEKTKGKTHKDYDKDEYDNVLLPSADKEDGGKEEKDTDKKPKLDLPLKADELCQLMESDPGEACRRMIGQPWEPHAIYLWL